MSRELYFLRSSEQKIVQDIFKYAHPHREELFSKYTDFYGLSAKDLGIYALINGQLAGAVWARKFEGDKEATLSLGVVEKFSDEQIPSFLLEQFLQEASAVFEALKVNVAGKDALRKTYMAFGFVESENELELRIKLEKKEIVHQEDALDVRKWMD